MPNRPADLTTREGRERYRDVTVQFLQDQALAANISGLIDIANGLEAERNHWRESVGNLAIILGRHFHDAPTIGLTGTTPAMAAE